MRICHRSGRPGSPGLAHLLVSRWGPQRAPAAVTRREQRCEQAATTVVVVDGEGYYGWLDWLGSAKLLVELVSRASSKLWGPLAFLVRFRALADPATGSRAVSGMRDLRSHRGRRASG